MKNSVDPDQLASSEASYRKPADLDIHSFQKRVSYMYFEEKKVCNVSF